MARDPEKAIVLKNEGNRHFKAGDWNGAEGCYTKAIIADDTNSALYTNRAMARLKLGFWEPVIDDCMSCIRLGNRSVKAYFYLSQAQFHMGEYNEALKNANEARVLCVELGDRSLGSVTSQILSCRKARWEAMEKRRLRETKAFEEELVLDLSRLRDEEYRTLQAEAMEDNRVGSQSSMEELNDVVTRYEEKTRQLREVFEKARPDDQKTREPPQWGIDEISYNWMIDPVVTKTGKSYERASIEEHLRRSSTDPLTREPLQKEDLRPNLALRQACEEFLEKNGWVADW